MTSVPVTADRAGDSEIAAGAEVVERYLRLLGDGDEYGAVELISGLVDEGVPPTRVMIDVVARAQGQVGELWAANEWSVAREHAATAISERAVAAVAGRIRVPPSRGRITVACVDGEWHALPVRILAEVLRLDGWRVDFLGANVPGRHLVTHLHQTGPDAVALSCMLPTRLPRAHAATIACRSAGVPVIAGGRGFGADGRHAGSVGADAWAPDAEAAAQRLARQWPPPIGDPHGHTDLGGDEYTFVVRQRPELIGAGYARLAGLYPPMASYDQRQRDATAEDLGHLVDFLAAALYVQDAGIFTDFVTWTAAVLAARAVPAAALTVGLEVLAGQLHDFPRAQDTLRAGIEALAAARER